MVIAVAVVLLPRRGELQTLSRRDWALLVCTSAIILMNWLLFTVAVKYGHVVDSAIATPFAIAYLVALEYGGHGNFTNHGPLYVVLTVLSGPITALTLMMFAAAAQRLSLVTLGLLQDLMSSLQLMWGLRVGHETMSAGRWSGLGLIWLALAVFSTDAAKRARSR